MISSLTPATPAKEEHIMAEYIIKCNACNQSHWSNEACPPIYWVCIPDWDGDEICEDTNWHEIHANSAQEAAEKYAEKSDDENDMVDEDYDVLVKKDNQIFLFSVWAETKIEYNSKDVRSENIENFEYARYCEVCNELCKKRHTFRNGKPINCKE